MQDPRRERGRLPHLPGRGGREGKKLAALARLHAEHSSHGRPSTPEPGSAWGLALADLGLLDEPSAPAATGYLWPDNVRAWDCWQGVQTQWRVGMGGATGLDYAGVRAFLDEQPELRSDERRDIWRGIQAAEVATLEVWAERREREQQTGPGPRQPMGL